MNFFVNFQIVYDILQFIFARLQMVVHHILHSLSAGLGLLLVKPVEAKVSFLWRRMVKFL